jgi:hypothetical protein
MSTIYLVPYLNIRTCSSKYSYLGTGNVVEGRIFSFIDLALFE